MDYASSASIGSSSGWTPARLGGWWFFADPSRVILDASGDVADWNSLGAPGVVSAPLSGNPTLESTGWSGKPSLKFDGASDSLNQSSGPLIDRFAGSAQPFSCLITMQASTILTINAAILSWDDTTPGSSVSIFRTDNVGNGRLRYRRVDAVGTAKDVSGTVDVGSGHVRVVISCTGSAVSTYVDGTLDINGADVSTGSLTLNRLRVGNGPGALNALEGYISDLVILTTAVSAADVNRYQNYSVARWGL